MAAELALFLSSDNCCLAARPLLQLLLYLQHTKDTSQCMWVIVTLVVMSLTCQFQLIERIFTRMIICPIVV